MHVGGWGVGVLTAVRSGIRNEAHVINIPSVINFN